MPCHLGADAKDAEAVASVPPAIYGLPLSASPEAASLRGSWTGGSVLVCRHTSMTRTMREWSHAPQLSAAAFGALRAAFSPKRASFALRERLQGHRDRHG